jgi:hypothetical protein
MINKDVLISATMLLNLNQQVIHIDGVIDTILVDYGVKAKTVNICSFGISAADWLARNHDNMSEWGDMSTADWLARNHDNMSEWGDMSTADCCFS